VTPDKGIIVVTGSNGRIGDAVMRRFVGRFESIVGFDRKTPAPPRPGAYMPVEITSDDSVREGLRTLRAHHGAHVASNNTARMPPRSLRMSCSVRIVGALIILLSIPRGRIGARYGAFERYIR
jgi:NAD(P)-dependent dehydrogenase (short-subunit alcohol dehydrogenase family)